MFFFGMPWQQAQSRQGAPVKPAKPVKAGTFHSLLHVQKVTGAVKTAS